VRIVRAMVLLLLQKGITTPALKQLHRPILLDEEGHRGGERDVE